MKQGKAWWPLLLRAHSLCRNIHRAGDGKWDKLREKWIFPFCTSSCGKSFCSESLSPAGQELLGGLGQVLICTGIIMTEQTWVLPQLGFILSQFYLGEKRNSDLSVTPYHHHFLWGRNWGSLNKVGICPRPVLWPECGDWSKMLKGWIYGWSIYIGNSDLLGGRSKQNFPKLDYK